MELHPFAGYTHTEYRHGGMSEELPDGLRIQRAMAFKPLRDLWQKFHACPIYLNDFEI